MVLDWLILRVCAAFGKIFLDNKRAYVLLVKRSRHLLLYAVSVSFPAEQTQFLWIFFSNVITVTCEIGIFLSEWLLLNLLAISLELKLLSPQSNIISIFSCKESLDGMFTITRWNTRIQMSLNQFHRDTNTSLHLSASSDTRAFILNVVQSHIASFTYILMTSLILLVYRSNQFIPSSLLFVKRQEKIEISRLK